MLFLHHLAVAVLVLPVLVSACALLQATKKLVHHPFLGARVNAVSIQPIAAIPGGFLKES